MKHISVVLVLLLVFCSGCNHEKKVTSYSDIYSEKPVTIYMAPIQDKAERRVEKYPKDIAYNNELATATAYLYQTAATPLLRRGYYVVAPVAARQIAAKEGCDYKALRNNDIKKYKKDYGIDAIMITTIHRWKEENGVWTAFLEYQIRSTKTNVDLMHTWVMARKEVPTNLKGDPVVTKNDAKFAEKMGFDNGTAQRCFLVEKVNDYVLRDLPVSSTLRQFERDIYKNANNTYIKYTWSENGNADVQPCSIEEYEQGCFI